MKKGKRVGWLLAVCALLSGCLKEPNTGPGLSGGYYDLEILNLETGRAKATISHTTDQGGAFFKNNDIHVTLYDRDSNGTNAIVNAVIDTNWQTTKLTNLTIVYQRGDIEQEISAWQQSYQKSNAIHVVKDDPIEPPYVEINFDAFTYQYYLFLTEPDMGQIRIKGKMKAYLTNFSKEE